MPDEPYRAPLPVAPDPYMVAWESMRQRQQWAEGASLATGLVTGAMFLLWVVPGGLSPGRFLATWALFMCGIILSQGSARRLRCPHCGSRWRAREGSSECARCGIKIGTPKSAAIEAEMALTSPAARMLDRSSNGANSN
jgi:hypothetical protein